MRPFFVFLLVLFIEHSQADFLCILFGNTSSILAGISPDGSTVTPLSNIPTLMNLHTITSQYYASGNTYYLQYNSKYLFSFNTLTHDNQTLLLPVPQTGVMTTFCVSQQFGTLYSLYVEANVATLLRVDTTTGSLLTAALPFTFKIPSNISQCFCDDTYSRIIWTYQSTAEYSIASTDLLPEFNGDTAIIFNAPIILQPPWLLFDTNLEAIYAITVKQATLYLSNVMISFETVKWVDVGLLPVNSTQPEGVLSPAGGEMAMFTQAGSIEEINVGNITNSNQVHISWGVLDSLSVASESLAWVNSLRL